MIPIPKIIHQTWKDEDIPYDIYKREWVDSWRTIPGFTYMFWTNATCRSFMKAHYPDHLKLYDSYDKDIKRADAIRYFLLHHFGGYYADLDCMRHKDITILDDLYCFLSVEAYYENHVIPHIEYGKPVYTVPFTVHASNVFMGSIPNASFWNVVFEYLHKKSDEYDVMYATGPYFLDNIAKNIYPVHFLPPELCTWIYFDSRATIETSPKTLVTHIGQCTWLSEKEKYIQRAQKSLY